MLFGFYLGSWLETSVDGRGIKRSTNGEEMASDIDGLRAFRSKRKSPGFSDSLDKNAAYTYVQMRNDMYSEINSPK
jgi:hypothetical protein